MNLMMQILDYIGVFAFAISGIQLASIKKFDIFGVFIVGVASSIGGGTFRDVLLNVEPFWINNFWYFITIFAAFILYIVQKNILTIFPYCIFFCDTLGLAFCEVIGIQKAIQFNHPFWLAIISGMITGCFGSVFRDILLDRAPNLFMHDFYAVAAIIGGIVYFITLYCLHSMILAQLSCIMSIIILRYCALLKHWHLPVLDRS